MFDDNRNSGTREPAQAKALTNVFKREAQEAKGFLSRIFYTVLFVSLTSILLVFLAVAFDWGAQEYGQPGWIGADWHALTAWSKANIGIILIAIGCLLLSGFSLAIGWYVLSDIYAWITGKELGERLEDETSTWAVCLKLLCYGAYLYLVAGLIVLLAAILI